MTEPSALEQIDATMEFLMRRFDELDHDAFDVEAADGKLSIELEDGQVFILSRQSATSQIWLAEPSGGWHFDWNGAHWLCDKRGVELIQTLEDLLTARIGEPIDLR
ncbi:MAG: iron donor protein CyaY [Planctomycetota bacterium]|jgi:CyaY protein